MQSAAIRYDLVSAEDIRPLRRQLWRQWFLIARVAPTRPWMFSPLRDVVANITWHIAMPSRGGIHSISSAWKPTAMRFRCDDGVRCRRCRSLRIVIDCWQRALPELLYLRSTMAVSGEAGGRGWRGGGKERS